MSKQETKPREFWIYPYKTTRMLFTYLTPQPYKQEAPENFDEIHVIEYKEYEKLKKQNEILSEALISYSVEQHHGFTAREALAKVKEL